VILVLREPVARAVSFFKYQKVRLRFPEDLPIEDYLRVADRLGPDDFGIRANEKYMAFQGGCYADYLPAWLEVFGAERLRVVWFEDLVDEPESTLAGVATFLGLDPARLPDEDLSSENRTTGFRSAGFQRLALAGNDRLERVFRRHPAMKQRIRAFYYRLNGRAPHDVIPDHVLTDLAARYVEPNRRLANQLAAADLAFPPWLAHDTRNAESA
jgi:Sulfotransferase domain